MVSIVKFTTLNSRHKHSKIIRKFELGVGADELFSKQNNPSSIKSGFFHFTMAPSDLSVKNCDVYFTMKCNVSREEIARTSTFMN